MLASGRSGSSESGGDGGVQAALSKKGKFVDKEMTCLEQLQSFIETRSTAWHLRR